MNILQRIASGLTRRTPASPSLYAPHGGAWTPLFGLGGRGTGTVSLTPEAQLAQNLGVVHVATHRIAEDIASLPVRVEVKKRGQGWVEDPQHPLAALLAHPCAAFDGHSLRYVLQLHLCLLGRAALLVVDGSRGEPRELHVLFPHRLTLIPDPVEYVRGYRYRSDAGTELTFPPFRDRPDPSGLGVLEVRVPGATSAYAGTSTVQAGAHSITLDAEVRAYARFYFANNAVPGAVLESDQPYPGVEAAAALRESWNETYQGMYNSGKIAPLWGGLKLRSIAPAFKDLAFPEISKATRQDILMHFGVPSPVVGYTDTGALGADTFSAALHVYQSQTLDAHRKRLERFFAPLAQRWPGCRVVIESPVEEDVAALEKRQLDELRTGAISREEYRTARGYLPDDQPNVWFVPSTTTVQHSLSPPEEAAPPNPPPDAARYRQMWSAEYRLLRDADDPARAAREAQTRWEAEGARIATRAARLRQAALQSSAGDLRTAYEALKAEARLLLED